MDIADVNLITIIITAAINVALGMFWYSDQFLGKEWRNLSGTTEEKCKECNMPVALLGAFVVALIMSFVLSHLLHQMQVSTLFGGATVGFWVWLGFYATGQFSGVLWEKKPIKLYYVNTGFSLVSLIIISSILALFG
jgi:hypothetical protein